MINLNKSDLDGLELICHGTIGDIYRCGDKIFKVYSRKITQRFSMINNPIYRFELLTLLKFNRLIARNSLIENTDLIDGVYRFDNDLLVSSMPYYNGGTLLKQTHSPFENRLDYSRQFLNNAKELADHYVYTRDFKLQNVMLHNGKVKIIDLDDPCTKICSVKNPYWLHQSVVGVDGTIKALLNEYNRCTTNIDVLNSTTRERIGDLNSFDDIENYIDFKSIPSKVLFVSGNSNITSDSVVEGSKVILVFDKFDYNEVMEKINSFRNRGIEIYDVVLRAKVEDYLRDMLCNECLYLDDNNLLVLK